MSDATMGTVMRLLAAAEAVAALGAHLRIEEERLEADPAVADVLARITAEVVPDGVEPAARPMLLGAIRAFLAQALDVLDEPTRAPGWTPSDPVLLQGQGRASASVVEALAAAGLDVQLGSDGARMLDVGTGAGWIAIAAARRHPGLAVVGIDRFAPALELARRNVEAQGLASRIELREQDVCALDDAGAFDLVWLPGPFLDESTMRIAVTAGTQALRPGGALVAGLYAGPAEPLPALLGELRTVRGGGHRWRGPDLAAVLGEAGLARVEEPTRTWQAPVRLIVGSRP